jgi:type IV pilus assembly protein PilM
VLLEKLKAVLREPPPAMAFEISEAGIAAARLGARTEMAFQPLKNGTLAVSPVKENVIDPDDFAMSVRGFAAPQAGRKRRDVALILPDFSARVAVLDFDDFPSDAAQQRSLIRFRLKRSVPFDVESAAMSYWAQPASGKQVDVVVAVAPIEIVARYEAPFRNAGMNPGLATISSLAALELAPESGLSMVAKIAGRVLTVLVRDQAALRLVRCLELPSAGLEDIEAVLAPTLIYMEDNLGGRAGKLWLCGFGNGGAEAARRLQEELGVETELLRSPLGTPGENNAGLLGYLRSIGRDN